MGDHFREDITTTLERLASTFAARDIMVSEGRLICASTEIEAKQKLIDYPSFDVIPIKVLGEIREYLRRGNISPIPIQVEDLVSDSTPILELANILSRREFCFVLSGKRISGYIHFSDLNNQLVKIPYFVLLEAVESRIATKIDQLITESDLDIVLPCRSSYIKKQMKKLAEEHADRGYINFLSFGEMLKFACHYKVLDLQEKDVKWVTDVRNRVDHADSPLIQTQRDAVKLVRAQEICLYVLNQIAPNEGK